MTANSNKSKQGNKAAHRVIAGVLCGASVLSLVLSLVMPPISQAIANDAQMVSTEGTVMGGGSSSESTDVDNTTNGDTENQNSDETEGDEAGDDALEAVPLSDDTEAEGAAQPVEDDINDESAIAPATVGEYKELNKDNIYIEFGQNGTPGNYRLTEDLEYTGTITLNHGETVIDLNGHKITHKSADQPLFNITGGATLTVMDGQQTAVDDPTDSSHVCSDNTLSKNGNLASLAYDEASKLPAKLTYYVTGSSANTDGTSTTETLFKHETGIGGAIVACDGSDRLKLINLYATDGKGGTFNLESGAITQQLNGKVSSLVYAQEGSSVNMSGGYICGASGAGAGGGIELRSNSNLSISGGVIAGNSAPSGGGVFAGESVVTVTDGIISGNSTLANTPGFGGGIMGEGSNITVSGGYITNNAYEYDYKTQGTSNVHNGNGCHGGGGIAALSSGNGQKNGSLTIVGGYITGNYSAEAGGGVYAGAWNSALSGFTLSGGTIASNVAQNSEGGGIRISAPTESVFNVPIGTKAYITNNKTNTDNDWGGGGVFVQGSSDNNVQPASLKIYNALITKNDAQGFGGGFAACPTGKTAITDTNGIAIFGNTDANGTHRSKGTHDKNDDADWLPDNKGGEITEDFKKAGHQDLFLIRDSANAELLPYIAAVTGQMLGGGAANWSGTIDNNTRTSIGKYEGAQAKYMIGLKSEPIQEDMDAATAAASLFITGNRSNIHGGGIMTNGDVTAGSTTQVSVYPKMKLNGTKALTGRALEKDEFEFELLKQNPIVNENGKPLYTVPSFDSKDKLQPNGCSVVGTVRNDIDGNFTFDLGEVYADDALVYYLVEVPGADKDVNYDKTIYKIDPKVVKDEHKSHSVLGIEYTYYTVSSVQITTIAANGATSDATVNPTTEGDVASVALTTNSTTFTNAYTKYDSMGSWTPKATKVVEGGEMKEFTLQLATDASFQSIIREAKTTGDNNKQTLLFLDASDKGIEYSLSDITTNPDTAGDSTGRGASKTFTYYMREKDDRLIFSHYKFDKSVYKFTVVATDNSEGTIDCKVTYRKGIVGSDGKWEGTDSADYDLTTSTPTFTNTYSTSLPLSGMSGVTLTYLAGAAVLCAAAAWMHIRRKANVKGGERRE